MGGMQLGSSVFVAMRPWRKNGLCLWGLACLSVCTCPVRAKDLDSLGSFPSLCECVVTGVYYCVVCACQKGRRTRVRWIWVMGGGGCLSVFSLFWRRSLSVRENRAIGGFVFPCCTSSENASEILGCRVRIACIICVLCAGWFVFCLDKERG